jgi:hypothetical protein
MFVRGGVKAQRDSSPVAETRYSERHRYPLWDSACNSDLRA